MVLTGGGRIAALSMTFFFLLTPLGCAPDMGAQRSAAGAVDLRVPLHPPLDEGAVAAFRAAELEAAPDEALQIVDLVLAQGVRLFERRPPRGYLDEIELSFFAAGRSLELLDLYREAVDAAGAGAWMRPRLAWLLERLGFHTTAEREARRALDERPEDADAHFVMGFVLGQDDQADDEALYEVLRHFREALSLDPQLLAPGGVTASDLRREVEALERRLATPRDDAHDHAHGHAHGHEHDPASERSHAPHAHEPHALDDADDEYIVVP